MSGTESSFNSTFFKNEKQVNDLLIKNIIEVQNEVLRIFKSSLNSANEIPQKHEEYLCFLQLIAKISINIESSLAILPMLYNDYRFKTSVNLIYRGIVSDMINFFYLLCCVNKDSQTQNTLANELNILHTEFIASGLDAMGVYDKFYRKNIKSDFSIEQGEFHKELFSENGTLKKFNDLRDSTDNLIKATLPKGNPFISEKGKLTFIENHAPTHHLILTILFKYYSQYQHFSPVTHSKIIDNAHNDLRTYFWILDLSCGALYDTLGLLTFRNVNILETELHGIRSMVSLKIKDFE